MSLKTRDTFPPGGWHFFQPQTNWRAPDPMSNDFNRQVRNIIAHRQANPRFQLPLEFDAVAAELENFTCQRLNWNAKYCNTISAEKKTPQPEAPAAQRESALFAERLRAVAKGASTLTEWLGEGGHPVDRALAQERATTCLLCPLNKTEDWLARVTGAVASTIRKLQEWRLGCDMHLENEQNLGYCDACGCDLKLKPWVQLSVIKQEMDAEELAALHVNCWILHEQ